MKRIDRYANLKVGVEMVFHSTSYYFTTRTQDGRFMAVTTHRQVLMMPDPDSGLPCMPTPAMLAKAEASGALVFRAPRLANSVRQGARDENAPLKDFPEPKGKKRDEAALAVARREAEINLLRDEVVRKWDACREEDRPSITNAGLQTWFIENFDNSKAKEVFGKIPSGAIIRIWIKERGFEADRRWDDMKSKRGKVPRKSRLDQALVGLMKFVCAFSRLNPKTTAVSAYWDLKAAIRKINAGEPVILGGASFVYKPVDKKLEAPSITTFRKEFHRANTTAAKKQAYGQDGKRAMVRGAGKAKEPVHALELVEMDSTPLSKYFIVDLEKGIPVGRPTVVVVFCVFTRCVLAVDVSFDQPSSATWFRALVSATLPKDVPEEYADYPGLADIGGYLSGTVVVDNAPENFSKAAEDASGDLFMCLRLAGEGEPTHKAYVESFHDRLRELLDELPGYTFDIKELRKYNFNPEKQKLITLQAYQKAVTLALAHHHVTPHSGLMGRCPLDVWQEQMAIHGLQQPKDVDQFLRSMGNPVEVIYRRDGFTVPGVKHLRYAIKDQKQHEEFINDLIMHHGQPSDTENPGFKCKAKFYDFDVGFASVFNPIKKTYIDAKCTMERYASGRTKWMHERALAHAESLGRKFYGETDEQVEDALLDIHERFRTAFRNITPQSSKEDRRKFGRFLEEETTKRYFGDCVNVEFVDPSPTGMESLVEHDLRSSTRRDIGQLLPRTRRGSGDPLAPIDDEESDGQEALQKPKGKGRPRHTNRREIQDRANQGGSPGQQQSPVKPRVTPLAPLK